MADQAQDHPDHPPERTGATRRHTTSSQKTVKSTWSSSLQRSQAKIESKGGPEQDHVPCYNDLHWEDVRRYLQPKFPGWRFHESKKDDRWIFVVPRKLTVSEKASIGNLRDCRRKDGPEQDHVPCYNDLQSSSTASNETFGAIPFSAFEFPGSGAAGKSANAAGTSQLPNSVRNLPSEASSSDSRTSGYERGGKAPLLSLEGNYPELSETEIYKEYIVLKNNWGDQRKSLIKRLTGVPQDQRLRKFISKRDIVFVVDNAYSMKGHWDALKTTLLTLAMKIGALDEDGLDLIYTCGDNNNVLGAKGWDMPKMFGQSLDHAKWIMVHSDKTNIEETLAKRFDSYSSGNMLQRQTLFVLTDGLWEGLRDGESAGKLIAKYIGDLRKNLGIQEKHWFTIQFISYGQDEKALARLKWLGDNFGGPDGENAEDVVDTKPWYFKDVESLILGSINEAADIKEHDGVDETDRNPSSSATVRNPLPAPSLTRVRDLGRKASNRVPRIVTRAASLAEPSVISTEPAIWELRRLLLDNEGLMVLLTTSVEQRGTSRSSQSLRLSLDGFGRDLAKEAKTKEQTQAAVFVQLKAREVSEMIMEVFSAPIQYKSNAEQQDARKVTAPDDTESQGRSVLETAEEDVVDSDEEFTAELRDGELSSLENVKEYILQSKAWLTLPDKLATLIAPFNRFKDSEKQLEVPQPENLASDIPEVKGKGLERQAEDQPEPGRVVSPVLKGLDEFKRKLSTHGTESDDEVNYGPVHPPRPVPRDHATGILLATRHIGGQPMTPEHIVSPKLDDEEVKAQPRPQQHAHEGDARISHSLRPIPKGFIQRLDHGQFRVKTRNRCNNVFEDIISVSTEEEAKAFFRRVDRYDPLRGLMRKLNGKLLDLYWNFVPPIQPGPTMISSLEEGTQTPVALEQASSEQAPHKQAPLEKVPPKGPFPGKAAPDKGLPEPASGAAAVVAEGYGAGDGAAPPTPADQHKVFICLALGRPRGWRLHHAEFTGQGNEPLQITDENIFRQVRTEMGKFLKSRGYLRFVFPLCLSKVEYYEFTLYNLGTKAVGLDSPHGVQGKLPSDHEPPPNDWRQRCPEDKWYFTAPLENTNEVEEIRDSLATATLTDAVRHLTEFSEIPGSTRYRKSVPWKLKHELGRDEPTNGSDFYRGWGFVLRFEFDMVVFLCIWGTLAVVLSLGLLGLYVGPSSPAHDQPGAAVAIFMAPIGLVGTCFGFASVYAKQEKYLD